MQLRCKLVHPDAKLPIKSSEHAAGLDLTAVSVTSCREYKYDEYDTGVAVEIPEGFVGLCFPRSSISKKIHVLSNAVGVIDSDYRGTIKARFLRRTYEMGMENDEYSVGDRIIQLVIVPVAIVNPVAVDTLSETVRGDGGFGSTGR